MNSLETPRTRRLKSDYQALQRLAAESTIFEFEAFGSPADFYVVRFRGRGIQKVDSARDISCREVHEVHIRLGAAYPRMMPELAWKTPVFHPNISLSGVVCLGGYGTYWVPSLALADLCTMLWDMVRFANFDEASPYNREAAAWAKNQHAMELPLDSRPLRDRLDKSECGRSKLLCAASSAAKPRVQQPEVLFLDDVVEAEIVEAELVPMASDEEEAVLFIR